METSWWRFKKTVFGEISAEDYVQYSEQWTEEEIKEECREWAKHVNSEGSNSGYICSWEKCDVVPKEFIVKKINDAERIIKFQQENITFWKKQISRKDKINDLLKDE